MLLAVRFLVFRGSVYKQLGEQQKAPRFIRQDANRQLWYLRNVKDTDGRMRESLLMECIDFMNCRISIIPELGLVNLTWPILLSFVNINPAIKDGGPPQYQIMHSDKGVMDSNARKSLSGIWVPT